MIFGSTTLKFGNGVDLIPVFGSGSLSITGLRNGKTGRFLEATIIKEKKILNAKISESTYYEKTNIFYVTND